MDTPEFETIPSSSVAYIFIPFLAVEEVAIEDGLEENVGLVTFGRDTKIRVQLTNDYGQLRNAIGKALAKNVLQPYKPVSNFCSQTVNVNCFMKIVVIYCINVGFFL